MTLIEALERVRLFSGGSCGGTKRYAEEIETAAATVGLKFSDAAPATVGWALHVYCDDAALPGFLEAIEPSEKQVLVLAGVGNGGGPKRETFDQAAIKAGFRRHLFIFDLMEYSEIESETGWIVLPYERVDADVERRFPLDFLAVNRDLHMDMTREAGRRSDAHLARYQFAREHSKNCTRLLDAACGLGYGSALLAGDGGARQVIGLDIDSTSVEYARLNFGSSSRVTYDTCDVTDLSRFPEGAFDAVVSFETIEHLETPDHFLGEIRRVLREDGVFIASVPYRWVTEDGGYGPYHHDWFDARKFLQLGSRFLTIDELWVQTAGGGHFCPHAPRAWRRLATLGEEPVAPAEWLIAIGRKRQLVPRRAASPWVFIAPGLPQLATMFAAAREWAVPARSVVVFGNSSFSDEHFDEAMRQAADAFGFEYHGNLFIESDLRIAGDPFDYRPDDPSDRDTCAGRIRSANPILESLRGCRLALTTRPNIPSDYALLAALEPIELRLVADGIQNEVPVRNFASARGFAPNDLARFPAEVEIWCPPWLERDTAAIGRTRVLDSKECLEVLTRLASLEVAGSLVRAIKTFPAFSSVIISQHFSRSGLTSAAAEHVFYLHQIRVLLKNPAGRVLFKAHPRDPGEKLTALSRAIGTDSGRVYFTTGAETHIPLESLSHWLADSGLTVFGTSSSALLGLLSWRESDVRCIDAEYMDPEVRRQAVRFSCEHGLRREVLRFEDPVLVEADRQILRRRMTVMSPETSMGMDAEIRKQLQVRYEATRAENVRITAECARVARELSAFRRQMLRDRFAMLGAWCGRAAVARPMLVWGAGSGGQRVLSLLRAVKLEPVGFLDGDPRKVGHIVGGLPIALPTQVLANEDTRPFIVVASSHAPAIVSQLEAAKWRADGDFMVVDFAEVEALEREGEIAPP